MQPLHKNLRNPLPDCHVIWVKNLLYAKVLIYTSSGHTLNPSFLIQQIALTLYQFSSLNMSHRTLPQGKHLDIIHEAQVAYDSVAVSPPPTSEPQIGVQLTSNRATVKGSLPETILAYMPI